MKSTNKCKFCEGEFVGADGFEDFSQLTMKSMLNAMFGASQIDEGMGIQLIKKNLMCFDNSSDEYADGIIEINYCPFCGADLIGENIC